RVVVTGIDHTARVADRVAQTASGVGDDFQRVGRIGAEAGVEIALGCDGALRQAQAGFVSRTVRAIHLIEAGLGTTDIPRTFERIEPIVTDADLRARGDLQELLAMVALVA